MDYKIQLTPEIYKIFPEQGEAPIREQMPLLIEDGRVPISMAGYMEACLLARGTDVENNWLACWTNTGDAVAGYTDGRRKFVPDSQHARELTPRTPLAQGAIPLEDREIDKLEGRIFTPEEIEKYANKLLTKTQAKANPFWKTFARDDQYLLNEFVDYRFAKAKHGYDKNMNVFLSAKSGLRLWGIVRLYRSFVFGNCTLDDYSRLIGVAVSALAERANPENPLNPLKEPLEQKRAFEYNGTLYVPVADNNIKLIK